MGVGIGGDYPLSAVISSEFASTRIRGRMMNAVFASQGWGQLCTPCHNIHYLCHLNTLPRRCHHWYHRRLRVQKRFAQGRPYQP